MIFLSCLYGSERATENNSGSPNFLSCLYGSELFNETREKFDAGLIDIPIANKHFRLKQYQKQLERNAKNTVMSLKILEQAAKDVGGQFTNRQELTGKNGEPLMGISDAELDKRIKEAEAKARQ